MKFLPVRFGGAKFIRITGIYLMLVALITLGLLTGMTKLTEGSEEPRRTPAADNPTVEPSDVVPPTTAQAPAQAPEPEGTTSLVDPAWVERTAAATGIPAPAVRAYGHATLRIAQEQPRCALGWTTLAGIGHIESVHGTIDGRVLGEDGRPDRPVFGPALDGREGFAAIRATPESTELHGDPTWDRAVGPMQFIPSTWAKWGADGDGDGITDPHDIDDAAYAAGRYLCADGRRLDSSDWGRAVFSYNHSGDYVHAVHRAAATYAARATSGT